MLEAAIALLEALPDWNHDGIHDCLIAVRPALGRPEKRHRCCGRCESRRPGNAVTPGGAIEILDILGREETLRQAAAWALPEAE